MGDRVILHSDLNAFFASVAIVENPSLRDKPVAVCGDAEKRHGIVLAKNELAKKFKIRTGDVIWEAQQKCAELVIVPTDFERYNWYSRAVKKIYCDYSDRVESFGIDEAWLDVTGASGATVAEELRRRVKRETGLSVSIGVSWNKVFAKLGSDLKKPDAVSVIARENYKEVIYPLPAGELLFVGRKTRERLVRLGIKTIGGIADADVEILKANFGKMGEMIWTYANGLDTAPVAKTDAGALPKSVGNSTTTVRDLKNRSDILTVVTALSENVASRLRRQWQKGQVVSLYLKDCDLAGWGKQVKIENPTFLSADIIEAAMRLYEFYAFDKPVRSVGVSLSDLSSADTPIQTSFFENPEARDRKERRELAVNNIRDRFGNTAISRAIICADEALSGFSPHDDNPINN